MEDTATGREAPLVLVVDDARFMRRATRKALEEEGFAVEEAADGVAGLEAVRSLRPDIVMLDIVMPGMDGFAACKELRKLPAGRHLPVLMVTGLDDAESIDRAYAAGATNFITKPINWRNLCYHIRFLLRANRAFETVRQGEERLAEAQRIARLGNWEWNGGKSGLHCSDECCRIFALQPGEFPGTFEAFLELLHPEDRTLVKRSLFAAFKERQPRSFEHRLIQPDGTERFVHERVEAVPESDGKVRRLTGTVQDVTELKRSEERLKALLVEKELLLREIHHRVKNNLQIVSSMLNLQSEYIEDPQALDVFRESRNRVQVMALLHEKLYQSHDLAKVDFADYIRELANHLFDTYRLDRDAVTVRTAFEVERLGLDTAIPCGLIVSELVSNCLKHAFPEGRGGQIEIALRRQGDGRLALTVADDGVGLPPEVDIRNTGSLGLQLVNSLAGQLGGDIELCRNGDSGSAFRISFAGPEKNENKGRTG